jgi:hypothetical protein
MRNKESHSILGELNEKKKKISKNTTINLGDFKSRNILCERIFLQKFCCLSGFVIYLNLPNKFYL